MRLRDFADVTKYCENGSPRNAKGPSLIGPFAVSYAETRMSQRSIHGADFWPPLVEPPLYAAQYFGPQHAGEGENQDTDKNLVGLKGRAGDGDHKTYSRSGGVEFSHHYADDSPPEPLPQATENERDR